MVQEGLDKHQLAGLDDRERGFSRPIEFEQAEGGYRAILRYEAARVTTDFHPSQERALLGLIQTLQSCGYHHLRTQMSFRNGVYLGSQELWVEYQDLPQVKTGQPGFLTRLLRRFWSRTRNE
jgi:hypothetical protein